MKISDVKSVYFIGIGGIGMSSLARYFRSGGAKIYGYDRTSTSLTRELEAEGMILHYEENTELIPDNLDLVIYTPAIHQDHKELSLLIEKKFPVKKRSEVLGIISRDYTSLAIAGTHGKTTTSILVAHILKTAGISMVAFLGGIAKNYNTNFLDTTHTGESNLPEETRIVAVTEADEYDRSFLQLSPDAAIITSMDDDHLDIYKNSKDLQLAFIEFASRIKPGGLLIHKTGLSSELSNTKRIRVKTYSLEPGSDYFPVNSRIINGFYSFDLSTPKGVIEQLTLGLPGRFNLENAVAATALAIEYGITDAHIRVALNSYIGAQRRFDFHIRTDKFIYIDDYAHHPAEITACIGAVKEIYPGKRITGIFQPHLFSRTRDFADLFARSLELLDEVILLDIYPARELPIPGITSQMLLNKIGLKSKKLCTSTTLLPELEKLKPEVLLTLGAGDIDQWPGRIVSFYKERLESVL